jgi:hypothetical protein
MNIYITLDYELFFGATSGSVEKCIIEPTEALIEILKPHNIKATFFVDCGYLIALEKFMSSYINLSNDYKKITKQIKLLADSGHRMELHIHPHWEDSVYDGKQWVFDTSRYRLSYFDENKILDIVTKYNSILERVSGQSPRAYRAGGWSAQPFNMINKALKKNNVFLDSSVYPGGYYDSKNQFFDFTQVPQYKTKYKFSNDLTVEDEEGEFTEIPISSLKVSPFFFWRFIAVKLLKGRNHISYGDGKAIQMKRNNIFRLLFNYSYSVASIDGYKASLLKKAYKRYKLNTTNKGNLVLIGHPKAFTKYSLRKLYLFIQKTEKDNIYKTF